jgi:hypothetical protein
LTKQFDAQLFCVFEYEQVTAPTLIGVAKVAPTGLGFTTTAVVADAVHEYASVTVTV